MRTLHAVLARLRGSPDLALALLASCVVGLLVTPVPPWVLDLCLAANLALSATVFVVALFARDALRLASFPTLLLFTTLLRLALEVSSTRLVLTRGEAGRVIEAFGRVVVAGNYVVGVVMFAILTAVQLLVVTKGAERVAEVAARFTLDALPGKQMSVDADVRAGAIDQAEARRRRRALEREGQLHGAMDGALKFVKGDALAGVAIVLVNVTGGLVAGFLRGLSLEAAARRYTLLAIGDGLSAQVPALLVSVAAGVAVTRVAAEEDGVGLAEDLARQLFSDPRALAAVAVLCAGLGLVPGLPAAPFLLFAGAAGSGAFLAERRRQRVPPAGAPGAVPAAREGLQALLPEGPLALQLAPDLHELARAGAPDLLPALEREIEADLGVHVPAIHLRPASLSPGTWRLLVDEVPAAGGRAPAGEAVALTSPDELDAVGIAASFEVDPLTGARVSRIASADAARATALAPVRGPLERLGAGVAAGVRAHAHLLLGVQEVQALLDGLESTHPALVREATRQVTTPLLAEVLRRLLEERISIRPLRTILEALLATGGGRSSAELAECCRRALKRHIAHEHARGGTLEALLLDPAAEAKLRESLAGNVAAVDPRAACTLLDGIERELSQRECAPPPVLLATSEVRRALRQVVAQRFPGLSVLSYDELPANVPVRPVGKIALAA